jgi:hypothetical protein
MDELASKIWKHCFGNSKREVEDNVLSYLLGNHKTTTDLSPVAQAPGTIGKKRKGKNSTLENAPNACSTLN